MTGWTLDPETPELPQSVHFYADGPAGSGLFAGTANANAAYAFSNWGTEYPGYHGFLFHIPDEFKDGREHSLYAYSIDSDGVDGNTVLLSGSPMKFTIAAGAQTVTIEPFEIHGIDTEFSQQESIDPTEQPDVSASPDESLRIVDSDGDKLTDYQEGLYGTDTNNPDTDGDGYPDGLEVRSGYSPLSPEPIKIEITHPDRYRMLRLPLSVEIQEATMLSNLLELHYGQGAIPIDQNQWSVYVNAYIYGGYTVGEIIRTLDGETSVVHPVSRALEWRNQ